MELAASPSLRLALVQWERLRLWYNGIMLVLGFYLSHDLLVHMNQKAMLGYWGSAILFGITANVFFSLGPALEAYLLAFRGKGLGKGRFVLFSIGLGFTLLMTLFFCCYLQLLYGFILVLPD